MVITLLLTTGIVSFLPLFLQPGDHSEYAFMLRRAMCSGDNSDIHATHSGNRPRFTRNQDRSEVLETSAGSLRNASTTAGSKRRPDSPCMVSRPNSSEDARR